MKKIFTFIFATLLSINVFAQTTVTISDVETTTTTVTATFTPNEQCASYYYLLGTETEMAMWVQMMGTPLEELIVQWGIQTFATETYTWTEQAPGTEYTIYVVPFDTDGGMAEMVTAKATTQTAGGAGASEIEMTVEVLSATSVKTFTTPNDQTSEYRYGLITQEYYNEIGEEGLIQIIEEDTYVVYEYDEWTWINLTENTPYYGYARGKNANGEWGTITLVSFVTTPTAVEDVNASLFNIYPNPATNFVKISGKDVTDIEIINALGQTVYKNDNANGEACISTGNLEAGVYFVKTNGTEIKKLVIRF